jgi:PAS domain S-box-containing protein
MKRSKPTYKELEKRIAQLEFENEKIHTTLANLTANEKRLLYALAGSSDSVWEWNFITGNTYYSPCWFEMLGYENMEFEMNFEVWKNLCHPDDFQPTIDKINEVLKVKKGKGYEAEFRMKNKTGEWIWMLGRGNVIERNENGEPILLSGTNTLIHERKKMEAALIQNEAHLSTLIDTIPDLVWLKDANGVYLQCNRRFEQFFGASKDKILGKTDYDFVDKELADFLRSKEKIIIATGKPSRNEELVTFANDGHTEMHETIQTPVYDKKDQLIGVLGIGHDFTIRKKTENELKENQRFVQLVAEQSPDIIYVYDISKNKNIFINKNLRELLNYKKGDVPEDSMELIELVIHPDDIKLFYDYNSLIKYWKVEYVHQFEYRLKDASGQWRWFFGREKEFQRENDIIISVIGIVGDITERKKVEQELIESEEQYSSLYESMIDAYVAVNETGKIIQFNQTYIDMLGFERDEFYNLTFYDITPDKWHEFENEIIINQILTKGYSDIYEKEYRKKNGTIFPVELRTYLMKNKSGQAIGMWAIVRDITERKKNETEILNYRNHLEELVKTRTDELLVAKENAETANRAKSEFLSNMSHELRTPLNAILGFSKLLGYQKNITETQKEQLTTVHQCGEHLLSLINDILDMSKIEAQKLEISNSEVNLPEILHTVFNINKVKADEKDLEFVLQKNISLPQYVVADERKLKQIMLNLINNAIKFTDEGRITIRVDYLESKSTFIFEVEDSGHGIPSEKQNEIFEPFIQHSGKKLFTEGTGLGLSITKKLVEMMDGSITLKSELEKGSTFKVEIPLKKIEDHERKKKHKESHIKGYEGDPKRILIVEDNQTNITLLVSLLEPLGFLIEIAEDGKIALQKITDFKPDLILLDYRMPVMNGLEFIQTLRKTQITKDYKIIGVSATVHEIELKKQFHDLCDGFISKPIDHELMFEKIKEMLNIKWIVDANSEKENKPDSGILVFPEKSIILAIEDNAEIGDFNSMNQLINEITDHDKQYEVFFKIIKNYIRNYDSEGILQFISNLTLNKKQHGKDSVS